MGVGSSKRLELEHINENHIIIAVVGQTGAGKSTFINSAVGREELEVGHGLTSETREIQHVEWRFTDDGVEHAVLFLEAPGFDSERDEGKIKEKLKKWLKNATSKRLKISGVLYLHRITDDKLSNPPLRHLTLLQTLCKESIKKFPTRVILVTTMWSELKSELVGQKREGELQEYWSSLKVGSVMPRIMCFDERKPDNSAESIVSALMKPRPSANN